MHWRCTNRAQKSKGIQRLKGDFGLGFAAIVQQMTIYTQGDVDIAVAQAVGDIINIHALGDEVTDVGMAETVEGDARLNAQHILQLVQCLVDGTVGWHLVAIVAKH